MLLDVIDVSAGYNGMIIIHDINISVSKGEIVCIIGPNGAGKSTVLRTVAGQLIPVKGQVMFLGKEVTNIEPGEKGKLGMIFIPQGDNIFPNLTVKENLEIAGILVENSEAVDQSISEVFDRFPNLGKKRTIPARELSGGERQLLALSRILLLKPHLVLLDEPSLGLAPNVVDTIFEQIRAMNRDGVSFLLVEQNARKGLSVSHRGYVLELGKNRLTGSGKELLNNPEVIRLYLGG